MNEKTKKLIILSLTVVILVSIYVLISSNEEGLKQYFESVGSILPLPIFTFLIAIVDGFNPCNLFILTLLLSLMLTEAHSRKKLYAVGFTFIGVVFIFYFVVMAFLLFIFMRFIGTVDYLIIAVGILAVIAGLINCKELFFYRKGITLMVQDKHVGPLKKRINHVAGLIKTGNLPTLISASILLAIFASFVELPCTAGFPIIYVGVLASKVLESSLTYYLYLIFYNLIYIVPLIVIVSSLGHFFRGKPIKPETMAKIKFIGGAIMILLGIILLSAPGLIGLGG
ncbi:MAG: hypothetical protein GY861_14960 [bacterium]|nr:hypothetical protein [bacterium]